MVKRKVKVKTELIRNKFHIMVRKCCQSCAFKDLTRCAQSRFCIKQEIKVKKEHVCVNWEMNIQQRMAGYPRGRVKCREYLKYVMAVREDEALAIENGEAVIPKTIKQLRTEFLKNHGNIHELV